MGKTYPNEIHRVLHLPGGDVGKECRKVAMDIAAEARRQTIAGTGKHPGDQLRTGQLAQAYQVRVVPGTNHFVVVNPKKYAAAIEKGAKPHVIRARRSTTLQFRDRQGRWRRVTYVNHPGSVGRRFLEVSMRIAVTRRYGAYRTS